MKRRRVASSPKREFWAAMRAMRLRFEESQRRAERDMEDLRERQRQTDAQLRRSESLFISQWGKLVESLVEGDLTRLLRSRGVEVTIVTSRLELPLDPRRREIDLIAVNGEDVVAVEVKTTMKVADVRRFVELLDEVRELLPTALRRLRIYGAMAYLRTEEGAARYAERRGLFVIRATGNSASIINAPGFQPRAFDPDPATNPSPNRVAPRRPRPGAVLESGRFRQTRKTFITSSPR